MINKLNGWQRLLLVLSVIYLLGVVGVTIAVFPKSSTYSSSRVYDSINAVGHFIEETTPDFRYEGDWTTRSKYYADMTDEQIISKLHEKYKDKVDFKHIENEYRKSINGLPMEQAKTIGVTIVSWTIPVTIIYALGIAVAWIIKGFRKRATPEGSALDTRQK